MEKVYKFVNLNKKYNPTLKFFEQMICGLRIPTQWPRLVDLVFDRAIVNNQHG